MAAMAVTMRTESVPTPDGPMDLHVWLPATGSGPGVLLLQEIFGVGVYLRGVAERLADLGYVVGAPDVFWRIERNYVSDHTPEGLERSIGMMPKFDFPQGVADCVDALDTLAALPEVARAGGRVGVMGFCLGGGLAWFIAARSSRPAAVVAYYGSAIADGIEHAPHIAVPTLLHFGGNDPYIPNEVVEAVKAACAGKDHFEIHVQPDAGHAFDNFDAPMFHQPEAAAAAWAITTGFLQRHLPVG
jgi:carboxymethylenebutenolidase